MDDDWPSGKSDKFWSKVSSWPMASASWADVDMDVVAGRGQVYFFSRLKLADR
jgi:hypothetical protein